MNFMSMSLGSVAQRLPFVGSRTMALAGAIALAAGTMAAPPPVAALASSGADLCAQVGYNAAFRGAALLTAVEVGLAESSCIASNTNTNPDGSVDRGLWQINNVQHPEVSNACAFDAQCNADNAYRISSGGTNWSQWTTYNSGVYLTYASYAQAAITRLNVGAHPDVVIDDLSGGFAKYGPSQYWSQWSGGYAGHIWWTYTNVSVTENFAVWTSTTPAAGRWRAFTYIPNYHGSTTNARYTVGYPGGSTTVGVNQNAVYNWWVPLVFRTLASGATVTVYLPDATGESSKQIAFDAVKWGWVYV